MSIFQIPVIASQQTFSITLVGVTYTMRLIFCDNPAAGWLLDIGDSRGAPIICGIPLKLGVNLLEQYDYLAFGGGLVIVLSAGSAFSVGYNDLGVNAQLYFVTPS